MVLINDVNQAIIFAKSEIEKKEGISKIDIFYGQKGVGGAYIITPQNNTYCVKFQKSYFYSFSWKEADKVCRQIGISFRSDQIYECSEKNIIPMVVLSDGKMYCYPAKDWIAWCNKYYSEGKNVIYKHNDRQNSTDTFTYYNIPISLVTRYNKKKEQGERNG